MPPSDHIRALPTVAQLDRAFDSKGLRHVSDELGTGSVRAMLLTFVETAQPVMPYSIHYGLFNAQVGHQLLWKDGGAGTRNRATRFDVVVRAYDRIEETWGTYLETAYDNRFGLPGGHVIVTLPLDHSFFVQVTAHNAASNAMVAVPVPATGFTTFNTDTFNGTYTPTPKPPGGTGDGHLPSGDPDGGYGRSGDDE